MNRQDLEHILAEGRTVEARSPSGMLWFRPTNPLQLLEQGIELRIAPDRNGVERGVELRVIELRDSMEKMAASERFDIVNTLMAGYCRNCGEKDTDGSCQCWNDE